MSEQKKDYWRRWLVAALIRAVKTFAQTAVAGIAIGASMSEINWVTLFSVAAVAAIASLLTSLGGLPEVKEADQ